MARKQFGMRLDEDLIRRADREAKRFGVSRTAIVEFLMADGLDRGVEGDRLLGREREKATVADPRLTGTARVEAFRKALQRK